MIQADEELLERARNLAAERGVSFPQLVREALERELALQGRAPVALQATGVIDSGGAARNRAYEPDPWR